MSVTALSTTFEPASLERVKKPLVPRLHPSAHGRSSWADGTAVRGAPPLREEVVRPQRDDKRKGKLRAPLHF
jgi:hypothetical protein